MRNLKKLLSLVLALALVLSVGFSAFAATIEEYQDADKAKETLGEYGDKLEGVYKEAVQLMIDLSVLKGNKNTDGSVSLDLGDYLTRGQFMVMLYKAVKGGAAIENNEPSYSNMGNPRFTDVGKGHWAYGYVNWAGTTGVSAGYPDGRFGVNDPITLEQALLLCMKAIGLKTQNESGFEGSDIQVLTLASQLGMLGDLYAQGDKNEINRATACLLFEYMIYAEQVKYSVVTGERYRTGNDNVSGLWASNPSWTLIEYAFGYEYHKYEVISDGAWFALEGSLNTNGKAIIKGRKGTFTLSADATKALGIELEDVGRIINVAFRIPSSGDVTQVFGSRRSYADSELVLNDIVNDNNAAGNSSISRQLNSTLGKDNYVNPAYNKIFVNYKDAITALNNDGKDGNETSWQYTATFSGITWPNTSVDTTNAFSAIIRAYNSNTDVNSASWNNVQKLAFVNWFNANRASTDPAAIVVSVDFGSYNYNNAKTRVIYDGDVIRYVFIENYTPAVFNKINGDNKLELKQIDRQGHGIETKNIKGIGAFEWKENDRVLMYTIAGKFGIKPVTEVITGTVSDVYGNGGAAGSDPDNGEKIVVNGTTYEAGSFGNKLYLDGVSGNYPGRFSKNWVGQEVTLYLYNGRVFNITGPSASPAKYALVIKSALIVDNNPFTGGETYKVELLLEDGTRDVYTLTGISGATKQAAQSFGGTLTGTQWGSIGAGSKDTGDSIYLGGNTAGNKIDDTIFQYSITGSNASLTALSNKQTASPSANADLNAITDYSAYWNNNWGNVTNKIITDKSVTFIKTGNTGDFTYKVYTGRTVPAVHTGTGPSLQYYLGDLNGDLANGGVAVRLAYLDAKNGSSYVDTVTNWAVALEYVWNSYNAETGKYRQAIRAMLPSGEIVTLYTKDDGTAFTNAGGTLSRGIVFTYTGIESAVNTATVSDNGANSYVYKSTVTSNVVVTGSNAFYAGGAYQVYTTSAKFYYVNSSGTSASDAKQITADEAAALGFSSGTWGITYFTNANGHATEIIIVKYNTAAGQALPIPPSQMPVLKTAAIYTGQGRIQLGSSTAFITSEATLAGKITITDGTNTVTPTILSMSSSNMVLFFNPIINSANATIRIDRSAFTSPSTASAATITSAYGYNVKAVDVNVLAGDDTITLTSNNNFKAMTNNNGKEVSILGVDSTGLTATNSGVAGATLTLTLTTPVAANGTVRVYVSSEALSTPGNLAASTITGLSSDSGFVPGAIGGTTAVTATANGLVVSLTGATWDAPVVGDFTITGDVLGAVAPVAVYQISANAVVIETALNVFDANWTVEIDPTAITGTPTAVAVSAAIAATVDSAKVQAAKVLAGTITGLSAISTTEAENLVKTDLTGLGINTLLDTSYSADGVNATQPGGAGTAFVVEVRFKSGSATSTLNINVADQSATLLAAYLSGKTALTGCTVAGTGSSSVTIAITWDGSAATGTATTTPGGDWAAADIIQLSSLANTGVANDSSNAPVTATPSNPTPTTGAQATNYLKMTVSGTTIVFADGADSGTDTEGSFDVTFALGTASVVITFDVTNLCTND